jgi:hypothetical protein
MKLGGSNLFLAGTTRLKLQAVEAFYVKRIARNANVDIVPSSFVNISFSAC